MSETPVPHGSVVVGVDGSPGGDRAVAWAARQARLEGRTLAIVHATGPVESFWIEASSVDRAALRRSMASEGSRIVERARAVARTLSPDLHVVQDVPALDARLALLELSRHASTLVLGSRGRGPVLSLVLGSVSLAVSQHADCPVVVVRPFDPDVPREGILVGVDETPRSRPAVEFAYRQAALQSLPLTVLHCFFDGYPVGEVPDDEPGLDEHRLMLRETVAGLAEDHPDVRVRLALRRGLVDNCLVDAAHDMDMVVVGRHRTPLVVSFFYPDVDRLVVEKAPCVVAVVPPGAHG